MRVDREQQRQRGRGCGVDIAALAGEAPRALDSLLGNSGRLHRLGRRMVQESAQCTPAKHLVGLREQDKLVPGHVHHLRRHGNHAPPGRVAYQEILTQRLEHQVDLVVAQPRVTVTELSRNGRMKTVALDERPLPAAAYGEKNDRGDAGHREKRHEVHESTTVFSCLIQRQ